MNIKIILLAIIAGTSASLFSMESTFIPSTAPSTKEDTIIWLKTKIQPINAGRFRNPNNPGAQANCTYCAEECLNVLAGLKEPSLVQARKKNLDIIYRLDDSGKPVYHEVKRAEHASVLPAPQFKETITIDDNGIIAAIDLEQKPEHETLKYITANRNSIIEQIKSMPGTALSQGADQTLTGFVYYYYKNIDAGHLANFYRDKDGNVFFVDAQSEEITETPPTKILIYDVADTMFFYPMVPKGDYYIKREILAPIKEEKKVHEVPEFEEKQPSKRQKTEPENKTSTREQEKLDAQFAHLVSSSGQIPHHDAFKIQDFVIRNRLDLKKNSLNQHLPSNALWFSVSNNNHALTAFLLVHGADPSHVNSELINYEQIYKVQNKHDQYTINLSILQYKHPLLLLTAARYNNTEVASKVLKHYENNMEKLLTLTDKQGNNALAIAIKYSSREMIALLRDIYEKNQQDIPEPLTIAHKDLPTPSRQETTFQRFMLYEKLAKLIEQALKNGDSSEQTINTIKKFIIDNAIHIATYQNSNKYYPNVLWYALCSRNLDLTRFCIAHNADPKPMIDFLETHKDSLDKALYETFMKIFTYRDPQLLMYAAYFENTALARLVVNTIPEISASAIVDERGNNPLMIAIMKNNEPLIKCFNKLYRLDDPYKANDNTTAYDLLRFYNPNYYDIQKNDNELEEKKLLLKEYKEIGNKLIKLLKKHTCKDITEAKITLLSTKNPAKNIALAFDNILQEKFLKFINEPLFGGSPLAHHIAEHKYIHFLALLILNGADITQKHNYKMSILDYLNKEEQSLLLDIIYYYYLLSQYDATADIYEIKPADTDMLKDRADLILSNYLTIALSVYEKFIADNPLQAFKWIRVTQLKNSKIDILTLLRDSNGSTVFHHAAKSGIFPNLLNLWYAAQGNQHYFSIKNKEDKTPLDYYTPEQFENFQLLIQHPEKIDSFTDKKIDSMIDSFLKNLTSGMTQLPTVVLLSNQRIIKIINFCNTCMKHNSREELKKIFSTPIASQKGMTLLHCLAYANMRNELYYVLNLMGQPNLIYDNAGKTFKDYLKKQ